MELIEDLGVIEHGNKGRRDRHGIYQCECGNIVRIKTSYFNRIMPEVCKSCAIIKSKTKHGDSDNPIYHKWKDMIHRCENPNSSNYKNYGAKGVTVCLEWKSYSVFKQWALTNGYKKGLVLDKDILCNELNIHPKIYSPETTQFITQDENNAEVHREMKAKVRISKFKHQIKYNFNKELWSSRIQRKIRGKNTHTLLGYFGTEQLAVNAYNDFIDNNGMKSIKLIL